MDTTMLKLDDFSSRAEYFAYLLPLLRLAWNLQTCADRKTWDESKPEAGQELVTAIVIRKLMGGFVLFGDVDDEDVVKRHYWNELDNGAEVDLTSSQFSKTYTVVEGPLRRTLGFGRDTRRRVGILMQRLEELASESSEGTEA